MKKRALRCSAVGDTSVICGSAGDFQRRFPGAARSHALGLLVCFCVVSVVLSSVRSGTILNSGGRANLADPLLCQCSG